MTIITDTQSGRIIAIGKFKELWLNGYPVVTIADGVDVAFSPDFTIMYENVEVPAEVMPEKYCYTPADGFYPNPNYQEPNEYGIPDELVTRIKNDAVTEIEEAVTNGTYE